MHKKIKWKKHKSDVQLLANRTKNKSNKHEKERRIATKRRRIWSKSNFHDQHIYDVLLLHFLWNITLQKRNITLLQKEFCIVLPAKLPRCCIKQTNKIYCFVFFFFNFEPLEQARTICVSWANWSRIFIQTINTPGWLLVWISSILISLHEDVDDIVQCSNSIVQFPFDTICLFVFFVFQCALRIFFIQIKLNWLKIQEIHFFKRWINFVLLSISRKKITDKILFRVQFRNGKKKIFGKFLLLLRLRAQYLFLYSLSYCISMLLLRCRTHRMIKLKWVPSKHDNEKKVCTTKSFFGCWSCCCCCSCHSFK